MAMYGDRENLPEMGALSKKEIETEYGGLELDGSGYLEAVKRKLEYWASDFLQLYLPNRLTPEQKAAGMEFSGSRNMMDNIPNFGFCGVVVRNDFDAVGVMAEFNQTRLEVEKWVAENGKRPVSSSKILAYHLKLNQGDLAKALWDTNYFLKFMSRANWNDGSFSANEENARWMAANVLDEFSVTSPNYNELTDSTPEGDMQFNCILDFWPGCDKNKDPVNQNGLAYHAWGLVSGLSHFEYQLIMARFLFDQSNNDDEYGEKKMASDANTALGLIDVEKMLNRYLR